MTASPIQSRTVDR